MRDKILRAAVRGVLATEPLVRALGALGGRRRAAPALDPQVAAVLAIEKLGRVPALSTLAPPAARALAADGLSVLDPDAAAMARVVDVSVAGNAAAIPVRIYVPPSATPHWVVYFHGGGGVIGSIATSDAAARAIAARTHCTVASVDYRLGPEHRHPAAIDDAIAAFDAMAARVPAAGRVAVAGDSFGGYLAACVEHHGRIRDDAARRPDVQALLYPIVDYTHTSPSIDRYADGYLLTRASILWFRTHYLNASDDRRAISPQFWRDAELRGAAPAVIATAGFDPLVDEGDAYAARLAGLGVTVRHRRYPSLVHGFLSLSGAVRAARAAVDEVCDDIATLLAAG